MMVCEKLWVAAVMVGILLSGQTFSVAQVTFTDVSEAIGVADDGKALTVSFTDYDRDGEPDIFVGNANGPNVFLRNEGGVFADATQESGLLNEAIGTRTWVGSSAVCGDYDNDGDLDVFFATDARPIDPDFEPARNYLYRNNDDGSFTDVTEQAGVAGLDTGTYGAVFADYDNDGNLDLYLVNLGSPNILYRNNGNETFTDVTEEAGVGAGLDASSSGVGAIFFDADNDGDLDLYAVNGFGPLSFFYENNGDGTFRDRSSRSGLEEPGDPTGAALGDYDRDGDLDLYVANFFMPNALFQNNGDGTFENMASEAGVDLEDASVGAVFFDHDNDGWLDLLVSVKGSSVLYRNRGDGSFLDVSQDVGLTEEMGTSAIAAADYDSDGDLDLYFANGGPSGANRGEPNVLYQNDGGNSANWFQVRVIGGTHVDAIGARVTVTAGGVSQVAAITGGGGVYQNPFVAHFGLGDQESVDEVAVRFPDGEIAVRHGPIGANQTIVIEIPTSVQPLDKRLVTLGRVKGLAVFQNYPNPFNPETWFPFRLGEDAEVRVRIHDATGRSVRELDLGFLSAGVYRDQDHAAYWDGRDQNGERVASGLYFYTIQAGEERITRRMALLK